jgi:HlyD family secretion protein
MALALDKLGEATAEEARYASELSANSTYAAPVAPSGVAWRDWTLLLQRQAIAMEAETTARDTHLQQLREEVVQLTAQIDGDTQQKAAASTELAVVSRQLSDLASLKDQQLVLSSTIDDLAKEQAGHVGDLGRFDASTAQERAAIEERQFQIKQVQADFAAQALGSFKTAKLDAAEATDQLAIDQQKLGRLTIKAPQSGMVHELSAHTVGGVIEAGETIMEIVPLQDQLVATVHIDPSDVDKVFVDQDVRIKLTGFDTRTTPELEAKFAEVSPDDVEETGQKPYYLAVATIEPSALRTLPPDSRLRAGMPVEAFALTQERSILSYLLHPLEEQLHLALRQ